MAKVGSLEVDINLQSAQFQASLKKAVETTEAPGTRIKGAVAFAGTALTGLSGALAVDAFIEAGKRAFDYADAIVDLSNQTGASTKLLQEFRYAAQMSGSGVESADAAVAKFTKNLGSAINGNATMAESFRKLGVTARDPDEAICQFADGIAKLPTAAARQSAAMSIMGKSAGDLAPLLSQGAKGFDELASRARSMGIVLEDDVLQNAGKVNDQLDTMKMILDAQFANMIVSNADALMTLANGFISAATAAGEFFTQMRNGGLIEIAEGKWGAANWAAKMRYPGMDYEGRRSAARNDLMASRSGRSALYDKRTQEYNQGIREGRNPKTDPYLMAIKAERDEIAKAEVKARRAERARLAPLGGGGGRLPTAPGRSAKPARSSSGSSATLRTDDELAMQWRDIQRATSLDQMRANLALQVNPGEKFDVSRGMLDLEYANRMDRIDSDTGTDREVREGKKRLTAEQAKQLKLAEQATYAMEMQALTNERDADLAQERFDKARNNLSIEGDILAAQGALARSTADRRANALALVKNQFEQQRLEAQNIIELEKLGKATKAQREAAEARLAALPKLEATAEEGARRGTQSPLEEYLDQIPRTAEEINDALEKVQVQGLENLENGLMDVIKGTKSVGDAFKSMVGSIIDGLIKIAIQQAIIKPLGNLLFGGGEGGGGGGGGGLLGSLIKIGAAAVTKGTPPINGRANGGMTSPGLYQVGERGPEYVSIGSNANVIPNHALSRMKGGGAGGVTVRIDSITSNDPDMVRRMVAEGVMQATPFIANQASDRTMQRLQRRQM